MPTRDPQPSKSELGQQVFLWGWQLFRLFHMCESTLDCHRGCHEIWEALVLQTSNMASAFVRNQMCTFLRLIKLICAIIICSPIGRVSSDSHLSDKAKIAFRTIGRPFQRPLWQLVKSPRYTGGDFMFLNRFVCRRQPQILVHAITFEQLFGFLSFLARLLALTCRLPD